MYHAIMVRSRTKEQQARIEALTKQILDVVRENDDEVDKELNVACVGTSQWGTIAEIIPWDLSVNVLNISQKQVESLFELAGFEIRKTYQLNNYYHGGSIRNAPYALASPAWLLQTNYGNITVTPRKRVFDLNWAGTGIDLDENLTHDDVTQGSSYVHAWSPAKLAGYLTELRCRFDRQRAQADLPDEEVAT
jgi:hypothetical protein